MVTANTTHKTTLFLFTLAFAFLVLFAQAGAEPTGVSVNDNITDSMLSSAPDNRTDEGGTINTLQMDILQQNSRWKAYVGNMTGVLTLSDSSGYSIFRWQMDGEDLTGNLFISGSDSISWSGIECSNQTMIYDEEQTLLFDSSSVDSINRTFNETVHPEINVGMQTISANTCRSTSTFVDDAAQSQSSADFPLVLLTSGNRLIYTSPVLNQGSSYKVGSNSDFQAIVPDIDSAESTTYYFYAELGV